MSLQRGFMSTWKVNTAIRILEKNNKDGVVIVAVCFRGSKVLSWGVNKKKTIPLPINIEYRYEEGDGRITTCNRHAEIDAIKKSKNKNIDSIVVVRFTKNGTLSKSMPCSMCRKFIEEHNINNVIYSDWDGNMIKEVI